MKINWKLRLQNKTTLLALIASAVSLVYIVLGVMGVVPSITESEVMDLVAAVLNALTLLGVVVDPTTVGMGDSDLAMSYRKPN